MWKYQPRGYDVRHRRNDRPVISSTPNRHPPRRHPGNLLNVCSREWLSASQFVGSRYSFFVGKNCSFPPKITVGPKRIRQTNSWNTKKQKGCWLYWQLFWGFFIWVGVQTPKRELAESIGLPQIQYMFSICKCILGSNHFEPRISTMFMIFILLRDRSVHRNPTSQEICGSKQMSKWHCQEVDSFLPS